MINQNPMQMLQAFNQFKNEFRGDPKAEVQRLLMSGQINQQQLNYLQNQANQFMQMLNGFKM